MPVASSRHLVVGPGDAPYYGEPTGGRAAVSHGGDTHDRIRAGPAVRERDIPDLPGADGGHLLLPADQTTAEASPAAAPAGGQPGRGRRGGHDRRGVRNDPGHGRRERRSTWAPGPGSGS